MLMQTGQARYVFPLGMASEGEWVRIVAIHGKKEFIHRLAAMGLTEGVEIQLQQKGMMGAAILGVTILCGETRWALDVETAQKILVIPVSQN
jgi:Fe2+ transport system protein FeoA